MSCVSTAPELSPNLTAGTGRRGRMQQEDLPGHSLWLRLLPGPHWGQCSGVLRKRVGRGPFTAFQLLLQSQWLPLGWVASCGPWAEG